MSFAGVSITVIVLAAIFVALVLLGLTGYRRQLLAGVIAFYPATLIFQNFPWYAPQTPGAAIGLWVGCFVVCFLALRNRVDPAPWPRLGKFGAAVGIALSALALLIALGAIIPLETLLTLPPHIDLVSQYAPFLPILLILMILL